MSQTHIPPAAMSLDDAAEYLAIPRATLDRLRQAGLIATVTIGSQRVIRRETLDRYLRSAERRGQAHV